MLAKTAFVGTETFERNIRSWEKFIRESEGPFNEHKKKGFHSTWVEIQTLAAQDVVETVDVVVMAEEVTAEVPMRPYLGRHLK